MKTPSLTIKDLFRLAFSAPVVWLSEAANEHPHLNWVVTGVEEAQPGDILLLSSVSNAARTLARAHELGTAAVIFLGEQASHAAAASFSSGYRTAMFVAVGLAVLGAFVSLVRGAPAGPGEAHA